MSEKKVVTRCLKTHKPYLVNLIFSDGHDRWCCYDSSIISENDVRLHDYNQFPEGSMYLKFPGCPYCRDFELLPIKPRKIEPPKPMRVMVTKPNFDDIGSILRSLNIKYVPFKNTFDCDLLFINCGTPDEPDIATLARFVKEGGCVYASDYADAYLKFGGLSQYFSFSHAGNVCRTTATVLDEELREIVGDNIDIEYDLPSWSMIQSHKGEVILAGKYGTKYSGVPFMIKVKIGKGTVFYTSFHNHAQASEKEKALLQLLVLKQMATKRNTSIKAIGSAIGIDVNMIKNKFASK